MPKITKDWYDPTVVAAFRAKMANGGVTPPKVKTKRRTKAEIMEEEITGLPTAEKTQGEKIDALHAMKWSRQRIALHLGIKFETVRNRISGQQKQKKKARESAKRAADEAGPTALDIIADRAQGMKCAQVAEKYGITVQTVYARLKAYRNGKNREAEIAEFGETSH